MRAPRLGFQFGPKRLARWAGAAVMALPLLASPPVRAQWSAANDEANRQRMMASMRATASANDRRNADAAFQRGLAGGRSTTGGSGGTAPSSSAPSASAFAATPGAERGPQSVVATRTVFINIEETTPQMVARVTREAGEGKAQSQYNLGRLNYAGLGVARDDVAARRWFGAAAAQGHVAASAQFGYLTLYGRGGPVDRTAARTALRTAAAGGDSYGQALYGFMLITDAVEKRTSDAPLPEAIDLLTRAADAGEPIAQSTLGSVIYFYGTNGAKQDSAIRDTARWITTSNSSSVSMSPETI
ncbi:MAG: sel1 repeat family protein [Sphingomonadales bacterium]|nr:MAG: sel1 repeat family protein [Sphingomonadales bacterium]